MNLPASAVSFLDAFQGACSDPRWQGHMPTVNVYTFSRGDEDDAGGHTVAMSSEHCCKMKPGPGSSHVTLVCSAGVQQRVEHALGGPLDTEPRIHFVREVAPNKRMLCVSFRLPEAVATAKCSSEAAVTPAAAAQTHAADTDAKHPPAKRLRTSPHAE
jgi:tRNA (guanine37-N1)-methyltransferase